MSLIPFDVQQQYIAAAKATSSTLEWVYTQTNIHFNRLTAKPRLIRYQGRWWCFKGCSVSYGLTPEGALAGMKAGHDAMRSAAAMDGMPINRWKKS